MIHRSTRRLLRNPSWLLPQEEVAGWCVVTEIHVCDCFKTECSRVSDSLIVHLLKRFDRKRTCDHANSVFVIEARWFQRLHCAFLLLSDL